MRCLLLLLLISFAAHAWGQGGPPMVTDDPGTPGDGHWEINTALQYSLSKIETVSETPIIDANYGWGDLIQLNVQASWNSNLDRVSHVRSEGMGVISTAVKWRFYEDETSGTSLSTYPRVDSFWLGASKNPDINDPGTRYFLPLELSKEFGKFAVNPEIGYAYDTRKPGEWDLGVVGSFEFEKDRELLVEVHSRSLVGVSGTESLYNFGMRYAFAEWISAIGAVGRSFATFRDEPGFWLIYAGAQFRL